MLPETLRWEDRVLSIIDQTLLPGELRYIELGSAEAVFEAICSLRVRGAPAIGICAAYGVVVGVLERCPADGLALREAVVATADYLATSRPTAVNLFWALDRMRGVDTGSTAGGAWWRWRRRRVRFTRRTGRFAGPSGSTGRSLSSRATGY